MERLIYINGKYFKKDEAKISVFDHGLLYGDGVFEGIRVYGGNIFKLKEHLDRLYNSASAISLAIPLTLNEMESAAVETLRINKLTDGYIRLIVTRGIGDLGLNPIKCPTPTVIIIVDKIELYPDEFYERGLKIITAKTRRNIPEALNPRIKSLNYLNNILAKIEANKSAMKVQESLMLNINGYVTECTGDNIFIVTSEGCVWTPPPYIGTLDGITRNIIICLCSEMGVDVRETLFTVDDIYKARECFLTGTAAEVIPVVEIDGKNIGAGCVGNVTKELIQRFRKLTKKEGA